MSLATRMRDAAVRSAARESHATATSVVRELRDVAREAEYCANAFAEEHTDDLLGYLGKLVEIRDQVGNVMTGFLVSMAYSTDFGIVALRSNGVDVLSRATVHYLKIEDVIHVGMLENGCPFIFAKAYWVRGRGYDDHNWL